MRASDRLASGAAAFVDPERGVGEWISYLDGGVAPGRRIAAVVFRGEPQRSQASNAVKEHRAQVFVRNHPIDGCAQPTIKDRLVLQLRAGRDHEQVRVLGIISGDEGGFMLEVSA